MTINSDNINDLAYGDVRDSECTFGANALSQQQCLVTKIVLFKASEARKPVTLMGEDDCRFTILDFRARKVLILCG